MEDNSAVLHLAQLSIDTGPTCLQIDDLRINRAEHVVLTGATGSGKSSLLETLVGLREPRSGVVFLRGIDCRGLLLDERRIGYVPQDGSLFTFMSVRQNLAYGVRSRQWSRLAREQRILEVASQLGIESLLDRGVRSLSGGEARRVAFGRAIAFKPDLLLLDEPTTGLDREARDVLYDTLDRLKAEANTTIVHATHDQASEGLADRVFRLEHGKKLVRIDASIKPTVAIDRATAS